MKATHFIKIPKQIKTSSAHTVVNILPHWKLIYYFLMEGVPSLEEIKLSIGFTPVTWNYVDNNLKWYYVVLLSKRRSLTYSYFELRVSILIHMSVLSFHLFIYLCGYGWGSYVSRRACVILYHDSVGSFRERERNFWDHGGGKATLISSSFTLLSYFMRHPFLLALTGVKQLKVCTYKNCLCLTNYNWLLTS